MTDTLVQHIDHPRLRKKFKSRTKFHDASTLKDIECYVRTVQAPDEPQNYEFLIEIFDKKASQYILLDEEYLTSDQPFCQQNMPSASELPIDYKDRVVNLKVQWIKKSAHDSASTTISLSNYCYSRFRMYIIIVIFLQVIMPSPTMSTMFMTNIKHSFIQRYNL